MAKEVAVRVETSHVEWGPVFAGALAAAALSFVLLSAAASLGLSLISAYPGHSYAKTGGTLAALWSLVVTIGSFLLGGYIAGRLRSSWREASADEVAFRDGMHGFLVWSLGIWRRFPGPSRHHHHSASERGCGLDARRHRTGARN